MLRYYHEFVDCGVFQQLLDGVAGEDIGGLLNGNQGVIQTMVGELVTLPEHEGE